MKKSRILQIIHWTAKILGILAMVFIGFFVIGFGFDGSDTSHYLVSIFSSIGLIISLIIAYKWPFAGGLLGTLFYLTAFVIDRSNDVGYDCVNNRTSYDCDQTSIFAFFALPALLFLIFGISQIILEKSVKK